MKSVILQTAFFLTILIANAQVPNKAEDISPLLIGETLPKASLQDLNGNMVSLKDIIAEKPTVLVFYRGGWCPYCNRQLASIASVETDILKLGYQIIAVSPDNYLNLKPTIQDDGVNYKLFSDSGAKLIQEVGIGFLTPEKTKPYIEKKTTFEATNILPVPTVFIVSKSGEILFEYINIDYKHRLSEAVLLAVLKDLK